MAGYQQADIFGDNDDSGFDIEMPLDGDFGLDGITETPLDETFPVVPAVDDAPSNVEDNDMAAMLEQAGGDEIEGGLGMNMLNDIEGRELEIGEKADDAIDYGDFSDDDLPDEEPAGGAEQNSYQLLSGIDEAPTGNDGIDGLDNNDDDLFGGLDGDTEMDSFVVAPQPTDAADAVATPAADGGDKDSLASEHEDGPNEHAPKPATTRRSEENDEEGKMYLLQMALFGGGKAPETQEENLEEWIRLEFPDYKKGDTPFFNRLFPQRPIRYRDGKAPPKPPKPIRPTKVNLDIESDQRLLFNSAAGTNNHEGRSDLVRTQHPRPAEESSESADECDSDEPLPGGITMQDLEFMCTDFDTLSHLAASDAELEDLQTKVVEADYVMGDDDDFNDSEHPRKKRRLGLDPHDIVSIHHYKLPSFDEPERATAKLARRTVLGLNDPQLLLEEIDPEAAKAKARPGVKTKGPQTVANRLIERFKTSNDEEYDMLKQNHTNKVRGQLGQATIDHSKPALRLQYPYYQVQLSVQDLRNWHRRRILFKGPFAFAKPNRIKRKIFKGKDTKEIYSKTKHLSLGDNSTAVLLEYSEEHPTMLSNTGMGNKVVNYYRRRDSNDNTRPKHEIGDLEVLQPQDKSPFNTFGYVDPGQEVSGLVNSMYKAPLFEQPTNAEDFLVIRETTGLDGQRYYLRNVDKAFVVGQELPTRQVPGISSRNVTSASKFRLRAIAYRLARRRKSHRIRVEEITRHFPDSTDMQNRQKMKEFMSFNKEHKEWEMQKGHELHSEDAIQELLKPEDIALLEAKDVGAQYLRDAGYVDDDYDEKDDKDDTAGNESVEQLLAPWRATKNFLQADMGKAMLQLSGEGDPSGRGEALSFLRISMKGGFKSVGGPVLDAVQAKKELGGHKYNVSRQQSEYNKAVRRIWNKQSEALSSKEPPSDPALEGDIDTREDNAMRQSTRATPLSTPGPGRRVDDETGTSFSRRSGASQSSHRFLKITRIVNGKPSPENYIETDPAVIKAYIKRKEFYASQNIDIAKIKGPTGNAEVDERNEETIRAELARLEANKARNRKRAAKKQAGADGQDGSALVDGDGTPTGKQSQPTQRKCANCGQVGHIKTNKKLCPLLNGSMKQDDIKNTAFMGAPPPPMV